MDLTIVHASIYSASVHIINFVNPLQFSVHINVMLKGTDSKFFFLLHKKSSRIVLRRGGSVDIPIMFAPEKMYKHEVVVFIIAKTTEKVSEHEVKHNLKWEYPIYGQPELRLSSNDDAPKITCCAKLQLEQMIEVTLVRSLTSSTKKYFNKPGMTSNCPWL